MEPVGRGHTNTLPPGSGTHPVSPALLGTSQVKAPFLPTACSRGLNISLLGLVTKFRYPFSKSHVRPEGAEMIQFAAELV